MVTAIIILLIIAFFIAMFYIKSGKAGAVDASSASRVSGGGAGAPVVPGQTSKTSHNPGSIPDGTGRDKGNGNAAMSTGMQG